MSRALARLGPLLAILAWLCPAVAGAQGLPPAVIAVLDYQVVLREAAAAKQIRQQIEQYRQDYQNEISREEEALRREEQELKRQRAILAPEAFEERRRTFERRVIEVQRRVQDRTRQLDRSFDAAMEKVRRALVPLVAEFTQEFDFNVVVDKSQILFASKALDITQPVLERLNQRLPTVEVPQPTD